MRRQRHPATQDKSVSVVVGQARHAARVGRVQAQLEQLKLRNDPDTHGGEETGTRVSTSHERRTAVASAAGGICPRGILHLWQLTMLDGNRAPRLSSEKQKIESTYSRRLQVLVKI